MPGSAGVAPGNVFGPTQSGHESRDPAERPSGAGARQIGQYRSGRNKRS